jgi:hypothetical protein
MVMVMLMILPLVPELLVDQLFLHHQMTVCMKDDETATIAITGVSGGGASESGTQSVTITIIDNENAPTVNFKC